MARFKYMRSGPRVSGAVILMYHRIANAETDPWSICVSPKNFADQLEALRRNRRIISLRQLVSDLQEHRLSPDMAAITFDDGYSDNFHIAAPLLERFSIPATFFLATGYIGRREFWWDELERLVLGATNLRVGMLRERLPLRLDGADAEKWPSLSGIMHDAWQYLRGLRKPNRLNLLFAIWRHLQPLPEFERRRALDELATILRASQSQDNYAHRPMEPAEAKSLAQLGWVEIGAHTVNHLMMSRQPLTSQYDEIVSSRLECEELAGHAPAGFAYPYGDMDADTAGLVKRAGFKYACSTIFGAVTPETNPFALPRVAVHNWSGRQLIRALT